MKYELWEVVFYSEGDFYPLLLNKSFENFMDAYSAFKKLIETTPCCIVLNKGE